MYWRAGIFWYILFVNSNFCLIIQILKGSEGHDGAKYRVSCEKNKLRVWLKTVVDFVSQRSIVLVNIIAHVWRNINTQIILFLSNIQGYVIHVPHMLLLIRQLSPVQGSQGTLTVDDQP